MIGLLARVLIGAAVTAIAGATAYGVYKLLTRENIADEIGNKVEFDDKFKEAFKAKYKERSENGTVFSFEILDQLDQPLGNVDLEGDEISSDIEIGDEILLTT
jgi:hypothetical protein